MNMKRKNTLVVLAILVMLVSCVAMLAGCNGKVTDIAISNTGKPRLVYVQGQDLDLSQGTLTAMVKGDATSVPMSAEGVTVTGYNKDQLGKQTLTVTYQGKTTTYEVTVVARMSVENQEVNYFVGDTLDLTKGRVKIANDNGTFEMVNLDSTSVTITGFNSASAGIVTLTAAYGNYTTTFDVTVYQPGQVDFIKPNKTVYQSHEKEPVLSGGYFNVTAAENPQFSKYIYLTNDMVTGYNPDAATKANRQDPMKQTLTVSYAGKTFQYDISILYSPISVIRDNMELLKDLDWSKEVTLTEEQGLAAEEAVTEYLKLSTPDKALVDATVLEIIARPAAQYLSGKLAEVAESFSDSFTLSEAGNLLFVGKTSEQLRADLVRMGDEKEPFNVYASLLRQMKKEFGKMTMTGKQTMEEYIVVTSEEEFLFCMDVFDFLLVLNDTLKDIPENWKVEDLAAYGDNISTAVYLIQANGLLGPSFSYVFDVLANWRTNDDYFDIIYSYYCYVAEDGQHFLFEHLWQKLPLPGMMQDWYLAFYNATVEALYMKDHGEDDAYLRDTTNFMYYYFDALRLAEEIKSCDNQLYKDVYNIIKGDAFMDQNVTSVTGGFVAHSNGLVASEAYMRLWEQYLQLIDLHNEGKAVEEEYGRLMRGVLNTMTDLSPAEVFGFLSSLKYMYSETKGTFHALDYSDKANNTFVFLVANYFMGELPEAARPMFQQMMLAMENYGLHAAMGTECDGLEDFKANMESMAATLAGLSAEDRAVFDSLLGRCYNKYLNLYNIALAPKDFQIDDATMEKIEQLKQTITGYFEVAEYMVEEKDELQLQATCLTLYALYEKANALYEELMASENLDVHALLATRIYQLGSFEDTLATSFYKARNSYVWYMFFGVRFEQKNDLGEVAAMLSTWAVYQNTMLPDFLRQAADLLYADFSDTTDQLDWEYVKGLMDAFRQLDKKSMDAIFMLNPARYLDALQEFLENKMGKNYAEMITGVLMSKYGHLVCEFYQHTANEVKFFKTQFETARALYEKLEDTTLFDTYLRELYEYYEAIYNSMA